MLRTLAAKPLFLREIAREALKNLAMGIPAVRSRRLKAPRTSLPAVDAATLERYAFKLPRLVLDALGSVRGKSIAEFGPGDHLATALVFLALGAESYACLDRFPGDYGGPHAKAYYRAVRQGWTAAFPDAPWPAWLDVSRFPEAYADRVTVHQSAVEDLPPARRVDVVCSLAVGEHVTDVRAFGQASRGMLKPGGRAVHLVDFSQHFDWSRYGDEFLFLCLSGWVWRLMGSNRGLPNRVRWLEFQHALRASGLKVETTARRESPRQPALPLAREFQGMPLESIRTMEATFLCAAG